MIMLIDGLVRGAIVLLLALAIMPALGRRSAALRHCILTVALVSALLAPVVGRVAPSWDLPSPVAAAWPDRWSAALDPLAPAEVSAVAPVRTGAPRPAESVPLTSLVSGIWASGVAVSLMLLGLGLARLRWLMTRGSRLTSGVWADQATALAARESSRPLVCVETSHPTLLATWGVIRPVVLVPRTARAWPAERVALVLAHEWAHVRRGDWIIQMAASLMRALHWFNPLAWLICVRLRREADQACDDVVLGGGAPAADYAEALVGVARDLRGARAAVPAMSVVHQSGFERRVARMLIPTIDRRPVSRRMALTVGMLGLAVLLPLAGAAAQIARATVSGSVSDAQRGQLPGVTLTLTHTTTGARHDVQSDRAGRFVFGDLAPGDYALEARLPGFALYRATLTVGGDGRALNQDLTLQVGTIQETITVRDRASGPREMQVRVADQEQFRRLEEARRKRAAQVCSSAPDRPASFIGGNVRAPWKFVDVRPMYPEHLRTAGVTGSATLAAKIGTDGLVEDVRVVSATDPAFASAATDAVSRWEFDATLLNCLPLAIDMMVSVRFDLEP